MNSEIRSLWIDPLIDTMQVGCIKSFLDNGHEFHLYTYTEIENVPSGVIVKDANEIIDKRLVFKDRFSSYATFSDWFRIKMLYEVGGWWVDCDVLCIKNFDTSWPFVFATEVGSSDSEQVARICNAVLKMPPKSELGKSILDRIEERLNNKEHNEIYWTEIGAEIICSEIFNHKLEEYVVSTEVFCPIDYYNYKDIDAIDQSLQRSTYGVHLWNKMWEWNNEDPISGLNKDSVLSKVFAGINGN